MTCLTVRLRSANALDHQSPRWTGIWFVANMAETSTAIELRCMREVVKKANLGVKQHGIMHARLCRRLGVER